jgi:hypothetical protein
MPVSVPFLTPSVQIGAAHLMPVHTPLVQSAGMEQLLPVPQGEQVPPQSTSASVPFFTPSTQVGGSGSSGPVVPVPQALSTNAMHDIHKGRFMFPRWG